MSPEVQSPSRPLDPKRAGEEKRKKNVIVIEGKKGKKAREKKKKDGERKKKNRSCRDLNSDLEIQSLRC